VCQLRCNARKQREPREMPLLTASRLLLLASPLLARAASGAANRSVSYRPSFLVILADDLGFDTAAAYAHPHAVTPHLDQLARSGLVSTGHHGGGSTCAPSRAALMSGRFPLAYPNPRNNGIGELPTVTAMLAAHGWAVGHFGKWHLEKEAVDGSYGVQAVRGSALSARARPTPLCARAMLATNATGAQHVAKHANGPQHARAMIGPRELTVAQDAQAALLCPKYGRTGKKISVRGPSAPRDQDVVMAAIEWLRSHQSRDSRSRPFYANVWFHNPHAPVSLQHALGTSLHNQHGGNTRSVLAVTPFAHLLEPGAVRWEQLGAAMRSNVAAANATERPLAAGDVEAALATYLTSVWVRCIY